jgi:hypothetical protein
MDGFLKYRFDTRLLTGTNHGGFFMPKKTPHLAA